MGGQKQPVRRPQGAVGRQGLHREGVQTGPAQGAGFQRPQQGRLVDDGATRQIDQEAARLDGGQHVRVEQVAGGVVQRQQQDGEVGLPQGGLDLRPGQDLIEMRLGPDGLGHADHPHAEGLAPGRQRGGDDAHADNDHGLVEQQALRPPLPLRRILVVHHPVHSPQQGEHVDEGHFGHLRAVNAARRGDHQVARQAVLHADNAVNAGGQGLEPAHAGHGRRRRLGQQLSQGDNDIGLRRQRDGLGRGVRQVNRESRPLRQQQTAIVLRPRIHDQDARQRPALALRPRHGYRSARVRKRVCR